MFFYEKYVGFIFIVIAHIRRFLSFHFGHLHLSK